MQRPGRVSLHFNPRSREGSDTQVLRQTLLCSISIHAPAKGATCLGILRRAERRGFQSTLPRRERQLTRKTKRKHKLFQSTLPRRERPKSCSAIRKSSKFQSTLPRRERHAEQKGLLHQMYFNPRSREGSDVSHWNHPLASCISIHAPAKGATGMTLYTNSAERISIHAPAKGATLTGRSGVVLSTNFNPRSREGSDKSYTACRRTHAISIHAPAKGATFKPCRYPLTLQRFQSTLPRRERP